MNSLCTARLLGNMWSSKSKLTLFSLKPCSKALTKRGVLGMSYVEGPICILPRIGNDNAIRLRVFLLVNLVACGLSLANGVRVVFGLVGPGGCPWWDFGGVTFTWWCFAYEGPRLPSKWTCFPLLLNSLALTFCLCLKKTREKKKLQSNNLKSQWKELQKKKTSKVIHLT